MKNNTLKNNLLLKFISSRELIIGISFTVITILLGINYEDLGVINSILIGFLEILIAIVIWLAKELSQKMESLKKTISQTSDESNKKLLGKINSVEKILTDTFSINEKQITEKISISEDKIINTVNLHNHQNKHVKKLIDNRKNVGDDRIFNDLIKIGNSLKALEKNIVVYKIMRNELNNLSIAFNSTVVNKLFTKKAILTNEEISETFQNYMEALEVDYEYLTVSNLDFWAKETIAHPINLLDANVAAAERGVKIKRVFLVKQKFKELNNDAQKILEHHAQKTAENSNIETKIHILPLNHSINTTENFGICKINKNKRVLLDMLYEKNNTAQGYRKFQKMEVIMYSEHNNNIINKITTKERTFKRWFTEENSKDIDIYIKPN